MGKHYLAQYYLKGFSTADSDELIWVYELQSSKGKKSPIANVAQTKGFYTDEVERFLANEVERSGHRVLKKLRCQNDITSEEKHDLARYICASMRRVPAYRDFLKREVLPEVFDEVFHFWERQITMFEQTHPDWVDVVKRRRYELNTLRGKWAKQLPSELAPETACPNVSDLVVDGLCLMTWRFLLAQGPSGFVTSDNPVFYDKPIGMNKPHSELSFPISTDIALWLSWRADLAEGFFPTPEQAVKEINRRSVFNATRFVFYHKKMNWVAKLTCKKHHRLTRLV